MKNYGLVDEHTPLTKTLPPDYVYMTNPNRLYRKQVHQFQCCICAVVLAVFGLALAVTILYSVDQDKIDIIPDLPSDNASLQLLLAKSWPLPDQSVPEWQAESPTPLQVEAAVAAGKTSLTAKDKAEAANLGLPVNSPSYRHQAAIKTSARATNLARSAYIMEQATKQFILGKSKPKNYTKTVGRGPVLATDWLPAAECGLGPLPACPPSSYRTVDGSCNNPYKPSMWGVAMRPYRRQLPPSYADGISKPRVSSDGSPLPSARAVSVMVHRPVYRDDPKFTVMLAVWGQFMDHDVTATALSLGAGGKPISCCRNSSTPAHPECFPVYLDAGDPYYQQFGVTCMEFVRSAPAPTCSMGPREQLNQVSSYLDGSVVYGNTAELSRELRSYQGGQLKMLETADGRSLLPISTNLDDGCNREAENAKGKYCFMTGDTRANENTHLTSLHLLMARQHNMIASQLADLNLDWDDEKLYQEARKIVAAQMQHITYNEFLPVVLGPDMMSELELSPQENGYYSKYDPYVDATISNNFASSAFRFAHTLLPALMKTVAKDWGSEESIEMHKMLFDPFKLYQTGALDKVLQSAMSTRLERADTYFNTQLTEKLFQATGDDDTPTAPQYGLDLVSLNVQRGRDHGLPPYPEWREFCGLSKPKNFTDMVGMVDEGSLERMKAMYKSVNDIDMYTGALSEFPIEGGLVGPTITCLISDQFKRLKQGDSFWYETDKQPQAFTLGQLNEIRKTTLANLICDTSDDVTTVQPEVMKSVSLTNARVSCGAIPRPDLTKWVEGTNKELGKIGKKPKSLKIGVSVTSGSIKTTSGELLWDGTTPVEIPLPVFSVKKAAAVAGGIGPFGHGVQWQGVISTTETGMEVSGTFSYPMYTHGPIPLLTNYTIQWVNGEFKFSSLVTSNNTDVSQLLLPGSYESPLYFSESPTKKFVLGDSKKQFVLGATEDSPLVIGMEKLPLILIGSYSPDRTSFLWSGEATLTIPSAVIAPPPVLTAAGIKTPSVSGAFDVIGGNIKLESPDGSSSTLWGGELPVAITIPMPYKVLTAVQTGAKFPVLGSGLVWSASISGNLLEGSFSLPQFNRTFGFLYVNWLSGEFSLEVMPLMLNATLDQLLKPGVKYSSRIILREMPSVVNLQLGDAFNDNVDAPGSVEDLVVESQEVIDGIVKAPIILHGSFSPDKTKFYFNGKVILAVRPTKPKLDKQLQLLKSPELSFPFFPWGSPKYGGIVNSGHLTAGLNGASPSTIWSGTLPVAIPVPTFFSPTFDALGGKSFILGNGVVWSGTLTGSILKGTFSLPQTTWSISGVTQQTWSGEFAFEVNPLWNATMGAMFVSGAKYYSKINFQGSKYEPGLSSMQGVPGMDPSVAMSAPLILQGVYSLDKQTFYWSGGFIIKFRNKPVLTLKAKAIEGFKIPKEPAVKPKASIQLDVTSGSIVGGFVGDTPETVWSGKLPATIPYGNLMSSLETWRTIPNPSVMWSGEVVDQTFQGSFAVPTYKPNGTAEVIVWWVGNFSFSYTPKWGKLLENYIKPGKKYNFDAIFERKLNQVAGSKPQNSLLQFTLGAQEAVADAKTGKILLFGNYYSKPFYCYIIPLCNEKQEFYWNGGAVLAFPDPPKNATVEQLKLSATNSVEAPVGVSSQFGGQVVSGSVQGGLNGASSNIWWSGQLPVQIPTSVFWTNKTTATPGLIGGRTIEWSGTLTGNTLKGTFSFPQLVQNFPMPTVQWWSGQFQFDIEPLWNTSLIGLVQSGVTYSSGIHFQGIKLVDEENGNALQFVLGEESFGLKKKAPIVLQGTISPDGSSFLWSGKFIMSVKQYPYPIYPMLSLKKTKPNAVLQDDPLAPTETSTAKPVKPKLSVSLTVITGQSYATNGTEPVRLWGGEMPLEINTDMFNPTGAPGAGVSVTWTPTEVSPEFTGTFAVTVYSKSASVIMPVKWTGNFSMHYLIKWSGALDGLVEPGKPYICSILFKEVVVKKAGKLQSPGFIDEPLPKNFVVGQSEATLCTLILNGKLYVKDENPFYCNVIPFMCSNKPPTNMFSFSGDLLLVIKPPTLSKTMSIADLDPDTTIPDSPDSPDSSVVQAPILRRINSTVISGSIVAAPEAEIPRTLWSGSFPLNISMPVFWDSEDTSSIVIPPDGIVNAHGVIWSGHQMGPRIEGSFSLPQYTKKGVKWWTGRFSFLLQTNWGSLGDLDGFINSYVNYNSKIIFRDIHSPTPLLTPTQFEVDTATKMPIILLGTRSLDRKQFFWNGDVIIGIRYSPWNFVNKSPETSVLGKPPSSPKPTSSPKPGKYPTSSKPTKYPTSAKPGKPIWPKKPKLNVGVVISKGSLTHRTKEGDLPLWSGGVPVKVSLADFNLTKGVDVLWTASTITPMFSGNFSIPQYPKNSSEFAVEWLDGEFSFDFTTLWNTSLDVIEIGKQYATVISSAVKLSKTDKASQLNSIMELIMDSADLSGSQLSSVTLKGNSTPDNMFYSWMGEAWFKVEKNKTIGPKQMLQEGPTGLQLSYQFGGAVYDGWVTSDATGFFSFSSTIWSGSLPYEIPLSSLWSRSIFGVGSKVVRGISWTATSVTDSVIKGTYSVPQISWDGIMTSIKYYKGEFQFNVRPLWLATLTSFIQPGMQYYSRVNFQGAPPGMLQATEVAGPPIPGIKAPIILQGTYSPDFTSFYWSGNFIINFKVKKTPDLV